MKFYNGRGEEIDIGSGSGVNYPDYNTIVKAIAHRGYSTVAPENTLPAYILARQMGFTFVETDVCFTKDGVAVCLHDPTIDRTSNGSGNIGDLSFAQVRQFDFGSWKSPEYAGTKIPTLEEFILLCRNIGLHPYIELKADGGYTQAQIESIVDIVRRHGMAAKATWISFNYNCLKIVRDYDEKARLGFVVGPVTSSVVSYAQQLKTETNEVFIDASDYSVNACDLCMNGGLPLEVWTINDKGVISQMTPYVTGIASDSLIAGEVLYKAVMGE